ncbi:MAG: hypothetical protein LBU39_02285 [Desulfobulbaceae bacterium]|nr:hypothetical protein [Desulfobulbaceae bacterium]
MIDALVFPQTRLDATFTPTTLIIRPSLLRPTEERPAGPAGGSEGGCIPPDCPCQAIQPPPLGEHLPRFLSLVADITQKGAAEGMSRLLLEARGYSGRLAEDENSRHLASRIGATAQPTQTEADLLWDERLFLTLAEFCDQEEAAMDERLRQLDGSYRQLLAGLRGDDAPPTATAPPERGPLRIAARLKAWIRLYRAVAVVPPAPIWLCLGATADEVFEMRAAKTTCLPCGGSQGQAALVLGELALPLLAADELPTGRAALTDNRILADARSLLAALPANADDARQAFQNLADAWRRFVDERFGQRPRGRLCFYDMGDLPLATLFGCQGDAKAGRIVAVWRFDS